MGAVVIAFFAGFFIGGTAGLVAMAVLTAGKRDDHAMQVIIARDAARMQAYREMGLTPPELRAQATLSRFADL